MKHIADRFTVILDANVLYPFLVRDVLLSFAHAGLYRARWSKDIMDEWTRHLIKNHPDKEQNIRRTAEVMAEQFPEALVCGYEDLIPSLELPDPDDRHVLAAAIKVGAHAIVTNNLKDFPADQMALYELEAESPDGFLNNTFELYPEDAIQAIRTMRLRYDRPETSAGELIMALMRSGLVQLAAALRPHFELL